MRNLTVLFPLLLLLWCKGSFAAEGTETTGTTFSISLLGEIDGTPYVILNPTPFLGITWSQKKWDQSYDFPAPYNKSTGNLKMVGVRFTKEIEEIEIPFDSSTSPGILKPYWVRSYVMMEINKISAKTTFLNETVWQKNLYVGLNYGYKNFFFIVEMGITHLDKIDFSYNFGIGYCFKGGGKK